MPRPRTPKQALRQGLAATLTLLLAACQQPEGSHPVMEAPAPQPVVVAPEPVIEAPVAVAVPVAVPPGPGAAKPVMQVVESPRSEISRGPSVATSAADAEARREAQDRLASLQEMLAEDALADVEVASGAPAAPIPQFPWPPPRASASAVIPAAFVKPGAVDTATLGDVAAEISAALDTGGYFERSYFGAPGGFAMVTRLERINPDGTPTAEAERWTVGALPLTSFSLAAYLRALFTAPSGHYRIIVFVVSSQPFAQSETEVERSEALAWLSEGLNRLPDNIALAPFTPQHTVTALIYEFEQPGNQEAMLMLPANLMGRVHLERAQLWDALRQ